MGIVFFHKNTRNLQEYRDFISLIIFLADLAMQKIISHTKLIPYDSLLFINTFNCDSIRQFIIKTAIREPDNILHSSNNTGLFDTTYDGSIMYYHTLYIVHISIFL